MRASVFATVIAGLALTSCMSTSTSPPNSSSTRPATSAASSPTAPLVTTPTTSGHPTASAQLSAYFAAATRVDQRLRAAAAVINGDIGKTHLTVNHATRAAIAAADPTQAARAIPPGLTPGLVLPVMLVQSDLMSRYFALSGFQNATNAVSSGTVVPIGDHWAKYALSCLGNGSTAAAAFVADLTAAKTAATKAPPVQVAAPTSRAAADLAVLVNQLIGRNGGCMSCGGSRETSLPTITWYPKRMAAGFHGHPRPVDGNINGIDFLATYTPTAGWTIMAYAC